jgi:hypothetical protein
MREVCTGQKMTAFSTAPDTFDLSSQRFQITINEIDKSVDHLQKTKEPPLGTDRNLRHASDKVQDVTIKKLTRSNPTMAGKFAEVKRDDA